VQVQFKFVRYCSIFGSEFLWFSEIEEKPDTTLENRAYSFQSLMTAIDFIHCPSQDWSSLNQSRFRSSALIMDWRSQLFWSNLSSLKFRILHQKTQFFNPRLQGSCSESLVSSHPKKHSSLKFYSYFKYTTQFSSYLVAFLFKQWQFLLQCNSVEELI
jgi:hypothetical protein